MTETDVTGLMAYRLRVVCMATMRLGLPPVRGPLLRGTLLHVLLEEFCPVRGEPACGTSACARACPICPLVATPEDGLRRAASAPRPFTVEPPLGQSGIYAAGDPFEFGLTLFGDPTALLPYVLSGLVQMGGRGMGVRGSPPGFFAVREVWAIDPWRGTQRRLWPQPDDGKDALSLLLPLTHAAACAHAVCLPHTTLALHLLTPLRLIDDGTLVRSLTFDVLLRRLMRRLDGLSSAATGRGLDVPFSSLLDRARTVQVWRDDTRWLDASSESSRTGHTTPLGGLVGRITFAGDLTPFRPWLVWGEITHVGKDATKGNGWYRLVV